MENFTTGDYINFAVVGGFCILCLISMFSMIYGLYKSIIYKFELNKQIPNQLPIPTTIDKLKEFKEVDDYLLIKLENLYNSFIYKKLLYTLKMYSSLAESTKKELRLEFIDFVDFNTTIQEREIYKNRWTFQQFKFIVIDYFNIKTTKLELFVIQKIELPETEFKDYKLMESLFNDLTSKDLNEILNSLKDEDIKNDKKAGGK